MKMPLINRYVGYGPHKPPFIRPSSKGMAFVPAGVRLLIKAPDLKGRPEPWFIPFHEVSTSKVLQAHVKPSVLTKYEMELSSGKVYLIYRYWLTHHELPPEEVFRRMLHIRRISSTTLDVADKINFRSDHGGPIKIADIHPLEVVPSVDPPPFSKGGLPQGNLRLGLENLITCLSLALEFHDKHFGQAGVAQIVIELQCFTWSTRAVLGILSRHKDNLRVFWESPYVHGAALEIMVDRIGLLDSSKVAGSLRPPSRPGVRRITVGVDEGSREAPQKQHNEDLDSAVFGAIARDC